MMSNRIRYLRRGYILSLIVFTISSPIKSIKNTEVKTKIDSFVIKMSEKQHFQGAILVAKDDTILYHKSLGYANRQDKILNSLHTPFRIGSLTKSFTAVTAMQFVEEGLLDLHVPIGNYLPNLNSELGLKLTLHLLLKMQSGLPGHLASITDLEYRDITKQELIQIINKASLSFEPGTAYAYSNINYTLVALILEEITGLSFREILNKRTFDPLQMTHSKVERTHDRLQTVARGYHITESGVIQPSEPNYMAYAIGSGDIYSSILDLYTWDRALESNEYLSESSRELLFSKDQPDDLGHYGYGFRIHEYVRFSTDNSKGKLIRHGGSMRGYLSNYHKYLDDNLTIIILGNIRPYAVMDITTGIKEIIFGRDPIPRNEMSYRY